MRMRWWGLCRFCIIGGDGYMIGGGGVLRLGFCVSPSLLPVLDVGCRADADGLVPRYLPR